MMNKNIILWFFSRIIIILLFTSNIQKELFIPFLSADLSLIDPWTSWLENSERLEVFPYGYIMFIFFIPAILVNNLAMDFFNLNVSLDFLVILTLLICEFYIYKILRVFKNTSDAIWVRFSLFSPLAIYITFIHGQLDVIPGMLIALAIVFISKNLWLRAGLSLGAAIAAKFSFILVLPFFVLFFLSKKVNRKNGLVFLKGLLPGLLFFLVPLTYSKGYRKMVIGTPEVLKILDAKIDIGVSFLYLVPVLYLIVILSFWVLNYYSNFILISYSGAALLMMGLTQTSSVGWFYWSIPFLIHTLKNTSKRTHVLVFLWQLSVTTYFIFRSNEIPLRFEIQSEIEFVVSPNLLTLMYTCNLILGIIIVIKLFNESLKYGDIYSLSKKPLSIGIAGDSGTGKDLLSNNIAKIFKGEEVSLLLGDDYHLFERQDATWLNTTHLSPDANDLELMGKNFRALIDRQRIFVKHYDHKLGKFTPPRRIDSSQVIVVNGLHSLLFPGHEMLDLKVFLSMDENLRIAFKMKRDKTERDHSNINLINELISKRKPHYQRFIEPQKMVADLYFNVTGNENDLHRYNLEIGSKDKALLLDFHRLYNSIVEIPSTLLKKDEELILSFEANNFSPKDASLIMRRYVSSSDQLFAQEPNFPGGIEGIMTLTCLLGAVRKRNNYA